MWSQRDPSLRKSGKGNIFIKNLDKKIDHKSLFDTFQQFGNILSCKIELDETNESKGYGYIQFATQEAADKAIDKVNGKMLNGKKVFVGSFVPRKERIAEAYNKKFTNVFIKNLDEKVDDEELKKMFSAYGTIKSAVIMRDDQGKSKGFGFVNFEKPEEAEDAVTKLNDTEVDGKTVFVGRAQKKSERESELRSKFEQMKMEHMTKYQGVNLYIKNLDDDIDDTKLRGIFDQFGTITSAKVMGDPKGQSKGFGFVCFSSPEEATKAVTEMNGKIVGSKPLYVALAQRKELRKAQLEAQFAQRAKMTPRIPGPAMYNGQSPMFYAGPPGQPGFVYPQMVPRGRFPPGPYGQPMPNYVMVAGAGRGGSVKHGGRGAPVPGAPRRGMKQPGGQMGAPQGAVPVGGPAPGVPIDQAIPNSALAQVLATLSPEDQKRVCGEKIYPSIAKSQPNLAGKITGMILESSYVEELIRLIEDPEALKEKVDEAMKVLKEHAEKTGQPLEEGTTAE
jgi:polyadenylate-binding protein